MLQPEDLRGRTIAFVASMPPRVCMNEILIRSDLEPGFCADAGKSRLAALWSHESSLRTAGRHFRRIFPTHTSSPTSKGFKPAKIYSLKLAQKPSRSSGQWRRSPDDQSASSSLPLIAGGYPPARNQSGDFFPMVQTYCISNRRGVRRTCSHCHDRCARQARKRRPSWSAAPAMFPSKNIIQNAVNSEDHTTPGGGGEGRRPWSARWKAKARSPYFRADQCRIRQAWPAGHCRHPGEAREQGHP